MSIEIPALPYSSDALEPFLSKETLETHYGKHHLGYADKLNKLIEGTKYEGRSLPEILLEARTEQNRSIFNNAAQVYNHSFLWNSMAPHSDVGPSIELRDAMTRAFGDMDGFRGAFHESAVSQFGSGWTWLVMDGERLRVMATANADTPLAHGLQPLLTLDVWEHAYYLDYKNERARYVDTYLRDHVNWTFADENFNAEVAAA